MKALKFERNVPRFAAARVASAIVGSGKGVRVGPLELVELDPIEIPGPSWVRLRPRLAGICGSDQMCIRDRVSTPAPGVHSHPTKQYFVISVPDNYGSGCGALPGWVSQLRDLAPPSRT